MTDPLPSPAFAHALFCDDIREEVAGKVTYVGTYGPLMLVSHFPVTLPKLCMAVFTDMPDQSVLPAAVVRLYRGSDLEVEQLISPHGAKPSENMPDVFDASLPGPDKPERRFRFLWHLSRACFTLDGPTRLSVRVAVGDEVLRAGSLTIQQHPDFVTKAEEDQ